MSILSKILLPVLNIIEVHQELQLYSDWMLGG